MHSVFNEPQRGQPIAAVSPSVSRSGVTNLTGKPDRASGAVARGGAMPYRRRRSFAADESQSVVHGGERRVVIWTCAMPWSRSVLPIASVIADIAGHPE